MLGRLIVKSLWRERDRTALIVLSVATAAALISAFLNISFAVTEEMAKELRSFGANILLVPKSEPLEVEIGGLRFVSPEESAYLEEADLAKLKTIFWKHNVVAFAPFLSRMIEVDGERVLLVGTWFEKEIVVPEGKRFFTFASGARKEVAPEKGTFRTGLKSLSRWWRIEGSWPSDEEGVLIGSALARRLKLGIGMRVRVSYEGRSLLLPIRGIAQTGGTEEEKIFVDLGFAQSLFGLPGKVEKVQVSALVTPDNALALRANRIGPASLPPEEYETWYCAPYLSSIVYQIEETIPNAKGKAVRRVSEAEATFLGKMRLTVVFTAAVALLVASLGVMATMVTAIFRRRQEIGLMKALGAEGKQLRLLFLLEAAISGLVGGLVGYSGGLALTRLLSAGAFILAGSYLSIAFQAIIFLVTLVVGVGVALVGSLFPVREAARLEPVRTLRGN